MLTVKRITTITPVSPKTIKVSPLRKDSIRIRSIRKLPHFLKSLLEIYDLNTLISERRNLLRVEELTILRLIEEKNERNKRIILQVLEDTHRKINMLNLKMYALFHEIPISENEIDSWKKEVINIIDYIYDAQMNNVEYPCNLEEFLSSKVSKLVNLKEALDYNISELEKKVEEFEKELDNIEIKYSIGLLDKASYDFIKGRIEETLENIFSELKELKHFSMQIGFASKVQLIENNLREILQQITQVEEKYRYNEINEEEYNRLISELKKKESNLNEQLTIQRKIFTEFCEKIGMLKYKGFLKKIEKLLV
ncbi:MAG: hypothetical protein QXJ72_06105 [Thermoproteota archaeon]